jgi:hypothetical protein
MSQAAGNESAQRRLKLLRFAFLVLTAITIAIVATVSYFTTLGNIAASVIQGLLWGALVGVVSVVVYVLYKRLVLKM